MITAEQRDKQAEKARQKRERKLQRRYSAAKYPEAAANKLRFLKVKIKSLAAEGQIIRLEERKALGAGRYFTYDGLYRHRVDDVRTEARASLLAYALLRGKPRQSVEAGDRKLHPLLENKVDAIVRRFGEGKNVTAKAWWDGETILPDAAS